MLCFDEFQVTDVADAAILHRLFRAMMSHGCVVVATSNRAPDELYEGGITRELFLPFIDLLREKTVVYHLDSNVDYRLMGERGPIQVYFSPLNERNESRAKSLFSELTHHEQPSPEIIKLPGRTLTVNRAARGVAWFEFSELCQQPLGALDYIKICELFHTVFITAIPKLTLHDRTAARRFITLVDAIYEHQVKLVCLAAVDPQNLFAVQQRMPQKLEISPDMEIEDYSGLFVGQEEVFMFARAVSRLMEMQSAQYLRKVHRLDTGKSKYNN